MNFSNKKYENLISLTKLKKHIKNNDNIINPEDIIFSINYYINKLSKNGVKITKKNKHIIILSVYILMCKYTIDDYDVEINSLFCGIPLDDYILYEKIILVGLNWKLEISDKDKNNSTFII